MYLGKDRKKNRWYGYDYNQSGCYFVTICTQNRIPCLGEIVEGKMVLNEVGEVVNNFWLEIPKHFKGCKLEEFVIMPNHIHGILNVFCNKYQIVGNADLRSLRNTQMLVPKIIHGFKSSVTRQINQSQDKIYFQWQKSFHDRVIRNEQELNNAKEYIKNNPIAWGTDRNNPINIK